MGSNMAEQHPVGFQWVMEARERGAEVIHIDPRFTRTSAMATRHVTIRPGSDIAFLGGVIRYVIENKRYLEEYVKHFTNAAVIVHDDYTDAEDLDGLFSGWKPERGMYDVETWQYKGLGVPPIDQHREGGVGSAEVHGAGGIPPEVYGLPPDPVVTTRDLPGTWVSAALAMGALAAGVFAAALAGGRR
jgi:formate dehydrogenase major subunit